MSNFVIGMSPFEIFSLVVCNIGWLIYTYFVVTQIRKYLRLKKIGLVTAGVIIDNVEEHDGDGAKFYKPLIEYKDSFGRVHSRKFNALISHKKKVIGTEVPIRFDPFAPLDSYVADKRGKGYLVFLIGIWVLATVLWTMMNFAGHLGVKRL